METRSELFCLLTCLFTATFTLLSIFSPLEMISIKIWETPLSWHTKCSLPVAPASQKRACLSSLLSVIQDMEGGILLDNCVFMTADTFLPSLHRLAVSTNAPAYSAKVSGIHKSKHFISAAAMACCHYKNGQQLLLSSLGLVRTTE